MSALGPPIAQALWRYEDLALGTALQMQGLGGAYGGAKTAAHAATRIHHAYVAGQGHGSELAARQAIATGGTGVPIHDRDKVRAGDGGG